MWPDSHSINTSSAWVSHTNIDDGSELISKMTVEIAAKSAVKSSVTSEANNCSRTRLVLAAILALFCLFDAASMTTAGTYQADGTYSGTPSAAVTAAFAANPNGGDALVAALRDLVIANPALADDVAYVGSRSNAAQQSAAGGGLAQAYTTLMNRGDSGGASRIVSAAQSSASSVIQTAVTRAVGGTIGSNTFQSREGNTTSSCTQGNTVSGAQPTTACQ